jgi:large subunit ribosomal protein L24
VAGRAGEQKGRTEGPDSKGRSGRRRVHGSGRSVPELQVSFMSRAATPVRKNDNVLVITGKDRGKRGRVLRIDAAKDRLVVEGVNMIKRHTKPNPGKNIKGGIVEREASVHVSNVQLVCPECGAQTRIGHKILGDGRKVRICRKCEGVVDK